MLVHSKDVSFSSATLRSILNLPTVANDDFYRLLHDGADYEALLMEMGFPGSHWSYSVSSPTKPLHVCANALNRSCVVPFPSPQSRADLPTIGDNH